MKWGRSGISQYGSSSSRYQSRKFASDPTYEEVQNLRTLIPWFSSYRRQAVRQHSHRSLARLPLRLDFEAWL